MKQNQIKWIAFLAAMLMLAAAGCQATPASTSGEGSSTAASQSGEQSASSAAASSETVMSQEESSSASSEPSTSVSSMASSSSTASIGEQTSSNSQNTSSYSFSSKVADKMQKIDSENLPDYIWVLLTPEASDVDKTYDSSFFPGIDVTVVEQEKQGWLPMYDAITSEPIENHPEILLTLKVNQPGWENFQQVVAALDSRDDISIIDFEGLGILE